MTDVNRKIKSTMVDISGKSWADLCDSSQSSHSQPDSPLKNDNDAKGVDDDDDDDLYDAVFQPVKKEIVKVAPQDDISLTSFMNNVHMVTPIKQEFDETPSSAIDNDDGDTLNLFCEDTLCSPPVKEESKYSLGEQPTPSSVNCKEENATFNKDLLHAKRRLNSECESATSNPVTPERANKVNKLSKEHKNIHDSVESPKTKLDRETDALILARRQKQIDFGKNTIGYEKYLEQVPKSQRKKTHPKTPPKNLKYTRRAWDGLVKNWRLRLHCWDPDSKNDDDDALTTCSSSNLCSLGSMNSLDSGSQASDSRPSTPPSIKRSAEDSSQHKFECQETNSSPDPVKFKKSRTVNK